MPGWGRQILETDIEICFIVQDLYESSKNICNTTIWSNAKSGKHILNAVLDLNDFSYFGLRYIAPVTSQTMGDDHAKNINKKQLDGKTS